MTTLTRPVDWDREARQLASRLALRDAVVDLLRTVGALALALADRLDDAPEVTP